MDQISDTVAQTACIVFFGSFFFNFLTGAGIQRLLQKLAMLQHMVYFPGLNLLIPDNVIRNFGLFKTLVAFDLYQVATLNEFFYDLTPTEPRSQ